MLRENGQVSFRLRTCIERRLLTHSHRVAHNVQERGCYILSQAVIRLRAGPVDDGRFDPTHH